jgi:glycosyltransferase involved in cell wall biosynthesis
VIEAYMAQCRVVGVSAGNLPYIVQPPDRLVEPNDPTALAEAISQTITEIARGNAIDRHSVGELLEQFTERATTDHLRTALAAIFADTNQLQGT